MNNKNDSTEVGVALPQPCSAVVTRYPTGCFGIAYNGSMFHWWGFKMVDAAAELKRLKIPSSRAKWQERYYDRRYSINDPRSYRTRKFHPQNIGIIQTPKLIQNDSLTEKHEN